MSQNTNEHIGTGLKLLQEGLLPFTERLLKSRFGSVWKDKVTERLKDDRAWDSYGLLRIMNIFWKEVFAHLKPPARSYVNEIIATRGRWVRQDDFSPEDIDRALDTMHRLLEMVGSRDHAEQISTMRKELAPSPASAAVAASPRILRDLRSPSPLPPLDAPPAADSSNTTRAYVPRGGRLTVKQVACELLCATTEVDGRQVGLPLDEILEKVKEQLPNANTTRSSLNIYQSQIRTGKHGYEHWTERLPAKRLRKPRAQTTPAPETALQTAESPEPAADSPESRPLPKLGLKEFTCELLCVVDESGNGLPYEEILRRITEDFPEEETSMQTIYLYGSYIKRGAQGFTHWTPKLPRYRPRCRPD